MIPLGMNAPWESLIAVEAAPTNAIAVVEYQMSGTGGNTIDITSEDLGGLTPKAAMFFQTTRTSYDTLGTGVRVYYSQGFCTATTDVSQRYHSHYLESLDKMQGSNTYCIYVGRQATAFIRCSLNTFIENGLTLDVVANDGGAYRGICVMFAGDDLEAQIVGTSGLVDETGQNIATNFEPEVVFSMAHRSGTWTTEMPSDLSISHGVAHNRGDGIVDMFATHSWLTSTSRRYHQPTRTGIHVDYNAYATTTPIHTVDTVLDNFDQSPAGFRVIKESAGVYDWMYKFLCLSWNGQAQIKVLSTDDTVSPEEDIVIPGTISPVTYSVTGVGFQPEFGYWLSANSGAYGTKLNDTRWTASFQGHAKSASITVSADQGTSSTAMASLISNTEHVSHIYSGEDWARTFVSWDEDGYTADYTNFGTDIDPAIFIGFPPVIPDAARHWMWRIEQGAGNGGFEAIEFRNAIGGTNLTTNTANVTASSQFSASFSPDKAIDGNASTRWAMNGTSIGWWAYDLGVGQSDTVVELFMHTDETFSDFASRGYIYNSDDGATWLPVGYLDFGGIALDTSYTKAVTKFVDQGTYEPEVAHRYWRIYANRLSTSFLGFDEVWLYNDESPDVDLCVTEGGSASASTAQGLHPASFAFNRNFSDQWYSTGSGAPQWIKWDFGASNEQVVTNYKMRSPALNEHYAVTWEMQYSDDNTNWVTVDLQVGGSAWGVDEERSFTVKQSRDDFTTYTP